MSRIRGSIIGATTFATILCLMEIPALAQAPAAGAASPRRTADGKPDLNGIWQALNTAAWDIQDHGAQAGPFFQHGAIGAIPPGQGIVDGGEIPYLPATEAKNTRAFSVAGSNER